MKNIVKVNIILLISILAGCGGPPEEEVKEVIEETLSAEEQGIKQQKSMVDLEKEEQAIFQEMMKVNPKNTDQLKKLGQQAEENLKERREKADDEKKAMENAAEEFSEIKEVESEIKDQDLKQQINQMQKTMNARYKAHNEISKLYADTTEINLDLYKALQQKETKLKQVKDYINKLNEKNKDIQMAHETFNQLTGKFNAQKKAIYNEQ